MSESFVPEGSYAVTSTRDCKHGQLARSCEVCDLESQLSTATALLKRMIEWDSTDAQWAPPFASYKYDEVLADARAFVAAAEGKATPP